MNNSQFITGLLAFGVLLGMGTLSGQTPSPTPEMDSPSDDDDVLTSWEEVLSIKEAGGEGAALVNGIPINGSNDLLYLVERPVVCVMTSFLGPPYVTNVKEPTSDGHATINEALKTCADSWNRFSRDVKILIVPAVDPDDAPSLDNERCEIYWANHYSSGGLLPQAALGILIGAGRRKDPSGNYIYINPQPWSNSYGRAVGGDIIINDFKNQQGNYSGYNWIWDSQEFMVPVTGTRTHAIAHPAGWHQGIGPTIVSNNGKLYQYADRADTIIHELGHYLWLEHPNESLYGLMPTREGAESSTMRAGGGSLEPTDYDVAAITQILGREPSAPLQVKDNPMKWSTFRSLRPELDWAAVDRSTDPVVKPPTMPLTIGQIQEVSLVAGSPGIVEKKAVIRVVIPPGTTRSLVTLSAQAATKLEWSPLSEDMAEYEPTGTVPMANQALVRKPYSITVSNEGEVPKYLYVRLSATIPTRRTLNAWVSFGDPATPVIGASSALLVGQRRAATLYGAAHLRKGAGRVLSRTPGSSQWSPAGGVDRRTGMLRARIRQLPSGAEVAEIAVTDGTKNLSTTREIEIMRR